MICNPFFFTRFFFFFFYSGCFVAASAYENRLAMFSVSVSAGSDIIDKVEILASYERFCAAVYIRENNTLTFFLLSQICFPI